MLVLMVLLIRYGTVDVDTTDENSSIGFLCSASAFSFAESGLLLGSFSLKLLLVPLLVLVVLVMLVLMVLLIRYGTVDVDTTDENSSIGCGNLVDVNVKKIII